MQQKGLRLKNKSDYVKGHQKYKTENGCKNSVVVSIEVMMAFMMEVDADSWRVRREKMKRVVVNMKKEKVDRVAVV